VPETSGSTAASPGRTWRSTARNVSAGRTKGRRMKWQDSPGFGTYESEGAVPERSDDPEWGPLVAVYDACVLDPPVSARLSGRTAPDSSIFPHCPQIASCRVYGPSE